MRISRISCLSIVLVFLVLVISGQTVAGEKATFSMQKDGQITVNGLSFGSLEQYFQSDYFQVTGKRCGTKVPLYEDPARRKLFGVDADCTLNCTVIKPEYWPGIILTIPVVVHIIHKVDGTGNIDDDRVQRQIDVLNEDFAAVAGTLGSEGFNTRIRFTLAGITRPANDTWFNDNDETGYKTALGWDQDRYCNIYVNSAAGYLGYTYLPQEEAGTVLDGIVVLYEAFGGRDDGFDPYDQGRTATHEMGHYLGLLHTFEGYACLNSYTEGDLIVDTPLESTEHYSCSVQTYTCGTPDPLHNYMNYTDDICMNQFTREQANRMVCSLLNYRSDLATASPALIPTLSEYGMILLMLLLTIGAVWRFRRAQKQR